MVYIQSSLLLLSNSGLRNMPTFCNWLLVLLLARSAFAIPEIKDVRDAIVVVNSQQQHYHEATIVCSDEDEDTPFTYSFGVNNSHTLTIYCDPPTYPYVVDLVGWVPSLIHVDASIVAMAPPGTNLTLQTLHSQGYLPSGFHLQSNRRKALRSTNRRLLQTPGFEAAQVAFDVVQTIYDAAVAMRLRDLDGRIDKLNNAMREVQRWTEIANATAFAALDTSEDARAAADRAEAKFKQLSDTVGKLVEDEKRIEKEIAFINRTLNDNFDTFEGQLAAVQNNEDVLWNVTLNLSRTTAAQINEVVVQLRAQSMQIQAVNTALYMLSKDVYMRREIIRNIFKRFNGTGDRELATTPFTLDSGSPPMSDSERQTLHSLSESVVLAQTHMQFTSISGGQRYANSYDIAYRCDVEFVLNSTIPGIDFATFFEFLGPRTENGTTCMSGAGRSASNWTCQCVITVTRYRCREAGAYTFPFGLQDTLSLPSSSETTTFCPNPDGSGPNTVQVTSPDISTTEPYDLSIFTETTTWNTWFRAFCEDTVFVASGGKRIRLISDYMTTHKFDFAFDKDDPAISDICDGSFAKLDDQDENHQRVSYTISKLWTMAYEAVAEVFSSKHEALVYGVLPAGVRSFDSMFNRRPDQVQAFRVETSYYARISDSKIPVYSLGPQNLRSAIRIQVDGGPVQYVNGTYTVPIGSVAGNFTISNRVRETVSMQRNLPKAQRRIGDIVLPTNASNGRIYDVPENNICASRANCEGSIDYIFQSSLLHDVDDPITLQQWEATYNIPFNPLGALSDPSTFIRRLEANGKFVTCSDQLNALGEIVDVENGNNDECTRLQFYHIRQSEDGSLIEYIPNSWSTEATIAFPLGTFTATVVSSCPSAYTVNATVNSAFVTFFTTSLSTVTIRVTVTSTNSSCSEDDAAGTYTLSAQSPLVLPRIDACGSKYVNVYPLDQTSPCYPGGGISVQVNQTAQTQSGVPPQISIAVAQAADQQTVQLLEITRATTQLALRLLAIPTMAQNASHLEELADAERQAYQDALAKAVADRANATETFNELAAETDAAINATMASLEEYRKLFAGDTEQFQKWDADLSKQRNLTNQLSDETAILKKKVAELEDGGGGLGSCSSSIPIIGDLVCAIWSFIKGILHWVVVLFLIYLVVKVMINYGPSFLSCVDRSLTRRQPAAGSTPAPSSSSAPREEPTRARYRPVSQTSDDS